MLPARDRYSPVFLAFLVCVAIFLVSAAMLFLPPYLGSSNNGGFETVLQDVGLRRLNEDDTSAYFDYYERTYLIQDSSRKPNATPFALKLAVRFAMVLDTLFTRDNLFDLRYLAGIYLALYLAAVFPIALFALERTTLFSEGWIIGALTLLIFGDVSYITRFASLYTQPLELIGVLSTAGLALLAVRAKRPYLPLAAMLAMLAVTFSVNTHFGIGGFVFAGLCFGIMGLRKTLSWKLLCTLSAVAICFACFFGINKMLADQTPADKYHAMTRGVLLQSKNPEETLDSFGISRRYSLLADTYYDQNFPLVTADNRTLQTDFLDRYSTAQIISHYIRKPGDLIGMLDISVKASYMVRLDFSGNYERQAGFPPRAKSPFMSLWSNFKSRSAPRTIAFFALVAGAVLNLYRRNHEKEGRINMRREDRVNGAVWACLLALILFSFVELSTIVVFSGDALMLTKSFLFSVCMDLLILFAFSQLLYNLDIIRAKK